MNTRIKRFLDFNGKKVYFLAADGQWRIAIKPICQALGVDFSRQLRTLKADPVLGSAWSLETMQVGKDQKRKWVCLPEFYIYGWLFGVQSNSKHLQDYKWKCYELLYRYFHGTITDRIELLKERTVTRAEAAQLRKALTAEPNYQRLMELQGRSLSAAKALRKMDEDAIANQLPLWENN